MTRNKEEATWLTQTQIDALEQIRNHHGWMEIGYGALRISTVRVLARMGLVEIRQQTSDVWGYEGGFIGRRGGQPKLFRVTTYYAKCIRGV